MKGQDELGFFTVPLDENNDARKYVYWTQNPFQIALTDQHGEFHFTLYASPKNSKQVTCKLCSPSKIGRGLSARGILQIGSDKYGESNFKRIMRYYLFIRGGKACLPQKDKRCWHFLESLFQDFHINHDELIKYVSENFHDPTHRNKERYKEKPTIIISMEKQIIKADNQFSHHNQAVSKAMTMFD